MPNSPEDFFRTNLPNCDVTYYPSNQPFSGMNFYPLSFVCVVETNVAVPFSNNVPSIVVSNQWFSQQALYNSGVTYLQSNVTWLNANFSVGITNSATNLLTATSLWNSYKSGTNSAAQTNALMVSLFQMNMQSWNYWTTTIRALAATMPSIQYNPSLDPTQH